MPGPQIRCALAEDGQVHGKLGRTSVSVTLLYPKNNAKQWKPIGNTWYCCTNDACVKIYKERLHEESIPEATPVAPRTKRKPSRQEAEPAKSVEEVIDEVEKIVAGALCRIRAATRKP